MIVKPSKRIARLEAKRLISSKVYELTFIVVGDTFNFWAGQFINLEVALNTYRSYSIASDPANTKEFKLVISAVHAGVGAAFVKELQTGDEITFIGPSGRFALAAKTSSEIIFLATGTGIAPFIAMLYDLLSMRVQTRIRLHIGVRDSKELFYTEVLDDFKEKLENFDYTVCLSSAAAEHAHKDGRVTQHYQIESVKDAHIYLCGHPNMIDELVEILEKEGVPKEHVFYEKFTRSIA